MNKLIYTIIIGIVVLFVFFVLGCWINIKKQKELEEKLKFKVLSKKSL